jgi:hypothetical protein
MKARGDAMKTITRSLVAMALLLLPIRGSAQTSTVPWSAIDMGFAVSSSSTTIVKSLVGQGFVGVLQGVNTTIESGFLADTLFRTVLVSVAERTGVPKEYALQQNYPNPFNPSTTIRFELPHAAQVSLMVYNVLGQEVMTLISEEKPAGIYEVQFDPRNLSSGMFVYRLRTGDFVQTRKLMLLK